MIDQAIPLELFQIGGQSVSVNNGRNHDQGHGGTYDQDQKFPHSGDNALASVL